MSSSFVLTWHGAGRGSDRFNAWLDALSHLKGMFFNFIFIKLAHKSSNNRMCMKNEKVSVSQKLHKHFVHCFQQKAGI
ncbi:hypothetical protein [Bacillus sp. TL12]|uniref:hypothetical protein n=1 Tax=Bacillus sp. TL12 TaxID=2894756 RepID=UPI001F528B1F|nr:hypothetical protein [Bacillus sp. TL12]MCI0767099.1 hypothetical protein [Bacillus sp. TL12]